MTECKVFIQGSKSRLRIRLWLDLVKLIKIGESNK